MRRCLILLHAVARAATRCDESRLVRRPDYAERLLRAAIQCNASRIASRAAVANLAVAGTGSQTLADALQAWRGVVGSRRGARPAGVPRLPRRRLLLGEAARRGGARVTPRATAHRLISHHDHRITVDHLLRTTKRWSTALDTFGEPQEKVDVFLITLRAVWKSNFYGAFVDLHAIDATPARWCGDAGSSPLDRARTAASSPRNDLVKKCRVHPTHWLISTQAPGPRAPLPERLALPARLSLRHAREPPPRVEKTPG